MKKMNEAIISKEHPAKYLLDKNTNVIYNGESYKGKVVDLVNPDKIEVYIPQLDKNITVHPSMIDEGVLNPRSLADTLTYLKSKKNRKLANKYIDKYDATKKNKYAKLAGYYADKSEDQELLATAPHAKRKEAKEYIKKRRDEIETNRMKDYLENGVGKEFYED